MLDALDDQQGLELRQLLLLPLNMAQQGYVPFVTKVLFSDSTRVGFDLLVSTVLVVGHILAAHFVALIRGAGGSIVPHGMQGGVDGLNTILRGLNLPQDSLKLWV